MKKNIFAVVFLFFSGIVNAATVSVTETVIRSTTLSDGSPGVDLGFHVTNNSTSDLYAFAVGNNTADSASGSTNDGEWSGFGILSRSDTNSDWTVMPSGRPLAGGAINASWLTSADLPGFTSGFYYENVQGVGFDSQNIKPGNSFGYKGMDFNGNVFYAFLGSASSIASPFVARGIDITTGAQTSYAGETAVVPLPASLLLFMSGLAGLFSIRKRVQ